MPKEDAFYGQVSEEITAGQIDKALWTKAFAHAEGDTNKAKALYLRYRATQLLEQDANRPEKFLPEGLSFTATSVHHKGKELPYTQVQGVTFYSVAKSINGIPNEDHHIIRFRSSAQTIEIKRTTFFKIMNGSRKKEFETIHAFANHYIFPALVSKLVQPVIERDQTLYLGGLGITSTGLMITTRGWFGSSDSKSLAWSQYYNCGLYSGAAQVYERANSKKGYAVWGGVSLQTENAILIPLAVNAVFQRCHNRQPPPSGSKPYTGAKAGAKTESQPPFGYWRCTMCGNDNLATYDVCRYCHEAKAT